MARERFLQWGSFPYLHNNFVRDVHKRLAELASAVAAAAAAVDTFAFAISGRRVAEHHSGDCSVAVLGLGHGDGGGDNVHSPNTVVDDVAVDVVVDFAAAAAAVSACKAPAAVAAPPAPMIAGEWEVDPWSQFAPELGLPSASSPASGPAQLGCPPSTGAYPRERDQRCSHWRPPA